MYLFNNQPSHFFDIFSFYKNLDNDKISEILKLLSNVDYIKATTVKNKNLSIRNSQIKWVSLSKYTIDLFNYLENVVSEANKSHFNFDISYSLDNIQYTEYHGSQKQNYGWHIDNSLIIEKKPTVLTSRKLSLTIQLSDPSEYEGGDLEIYIPHPEEPQIVKVPKEKGKVIVFPSYLWHRVTPVTKGVRKSLVWWVGGIPFR